MTILKNEYRPANVEFEVATSEVPETLGYFDNHEEMAKFMAKSVIAINEKITATRHMDNYEKSEMRREYNDLLENKLPYIRKDLQKAEIALMEAKDLVKELKSQEDGCRAEVESLAVQVRIGTKDINLDDKFTYRVAYQKKYFYYTYMDQALKLAKIKDIPAHELNNLYNDQNRNAMFFEGKTDVDFKEDVDTDTGEVTKNADEAYLKGEISAVEFMNETGMAEDLPVITSILEEDESMNSDEIPEEQYEQA